MSNIKKQRHLTYSLSGDVEEHVFPFIDFVDKYVFDPGDKIDILFDSPGGTFAGAESLTKKINQLVDSGVIITVIAMGQVSSAAFDVFFFSKAFKEVNTGSMAIVHSAKSTIEIEFTGFNESEIRLNVEATQRQLRLINDILLSNLAKIGASDVILDRVKNDEDVMVTCEILKEWAKTAEKVFCVAGEAKNA